LITLSFNMATIKVADELQPQHDILRLKGSAETAYTKDYVVSQPLGKFVIHTHPELAAIDLTDAATVQLTVDNLKHGVHISMDNGAAKLATVNLPALSALRAASFRGGDVIPIRISYSADSANHTIKLQKNGADTVSYLGKGNDTHTVNDTKNGFWVYWLHLSNAAATTATLSLEGVAA